MEHKISAFSFPRFRVETNENSKTRKEKRGNQIFHLFAQCSEVKREVSATLPDSSLRACLYEAGWPVSELAHLQVRSCLPGHNFVNISLRLYVCRAG